MLLALERCWSTTKKSSAPSEPSVCSRCCSLSPQDPAQGHRPAVPRVQLPPFPHYNRTGDVLLGKRELLTPPLERPSLFVASHHCNSTATAPGSTPGEGGSWRDQPAPVARIFCPMQGGQQTRDKANSKSDHKNLPTSGNRVGVSQEGQGKLGLCLAHGTPECHPGSPPRNRHYGGAATALNNIYTVVTKSS